MTKTQKIGYQNGNYPDLTEEISGGVFGKSYRCELPEDYVHMLNCICEFEDITGSRCEEGGIFHQGANKLDTSQWSHVINNAYMKPSVKRPYYYIINIEDPNKTTGSGIISDDIKKDPNNSGTRYGNATLPIM